GIVLAANYPDDGIRTLSSQNEILILDVQIAKTTPLKIGDVVLEVDNHVVSQYIPIYSWYLGKHAGDTATFLVKRGSETLQLKVKLSKPTADELVNRLMPLLIALVFLIVGLGVGAFAPATPSTELGFWFFIFSSLLLTSGQLSWTGPPIFINVYNLLWWIIGPLAIHFHLFFPQEAKFKYRNHLILLLYFIGLVGGILNIYWGNHINANYPLIIQVIDASRYFLGLNLLCVAILLYHHYRNASDLGVRSKVRLIMLGGLLSVVPFITFYILPEILINKPILPHYFTFFWISFLPLTYGYAIFRYQIIEFERHVNRGATVLLVFSILVGIYISIFSVLEKLLPSQILYDPTLNTFLILLLSASIFPISRRVQRLVDTMFYGGWYDYRSAIL
ncbi:MAG: PDZ domain-containing protein, partial [Anaerolineales bacterium]